MPGLILHTSNQLDLLAQQLAGVVSVPLPSPFLRETVVVQSLASRRWLSLKLAQITGICANYEFPFLGDLVSQLIEESNPTESDLAKLPIEVFTWKIDFLLPQRLAHTEFAPVAKYLKDGDSLKRFQLARKLASLFDQYRVYRPEMVSRWSAGKETRRGDEPWQAALWREFGEGRAFDQALEHLRVRGFENAPPLKLPPRVSVFAPPSLPPAYLDLLFQLARVREVHFFLLRPSKEYRGDDPTAKRRARLGLRAGDPATSNPLVTSWGKVDADLTDLLLDTEERLNVPVTTGSEEFEEFESPNLLGTLKSDILAARNRGAEGGDDPAPRTSVSPEDRSLVLHSCHSPMREVEVLYDQLLDCFETMPGLRPRDILVLTPEIEKYAPLIRGVFGYPEKDSMRIPYSLADRHPRSESLPIDTFLTLLDLPGSRYTAPQIFALLGSHAFRRRFHFSDDDLSLIRDWIDETAIRWGIDSADRARVGLPAMDANTWRHGLDRLLLGYAMAGGDKHLFEGILPHDEVEGNGADVLGRFITAAEALFRLTENFEHPRPLASWVEPLQQVIEQFLDPLGEDERRDVRFLRSTIDRLRTLANAMEVQPDVEFRLVRHHLAEQLGAMEQRGQFFQGGVTFCALKPVRSIPARVVCLLGINDQLFPRRPTVSQFDLMDRSPRAGDPSARHDDRYSFLETLLCAREKLSISYVGRSAIHNKDIPPSVVVSELLDYLNQAFVFPGKQKAEEFVLTEHPLHAFSPRYFSPADVDKRFFSYSEANAEASRSIIERRAPAMPPFLTDALPPIEETNRNLVLPELIEFWGNPARYFVRRRLGLTLRQGDGCLSDTEPFDLDNLEKYLINQQLLEEELTSGAPLPPDIFTARGLFPPGAIGSLMLRSMTTDVRDLAALVQSFTGKGEKDEPVNIDLELGAFTLTGKVTSRYGGTSLHFRTANVNPKDHLRAWIEHLALCVMNESKQTRTVLIGKDAVVTFNPVASARIELQKLCELFWQGLTSPLPFFPTSAMAFVKDKMSKGKDPITKARSKWNGSQYQRGEKEDRFFVRCFGNSDPLDQRFAEIAAVVFEPMFQPGIRKELSR